MMLLFQVLSIFFFTHLGLKTRKHLQLWTMLLLAKTLWTCSFVFDVTIQNRDGSLFSHCNSDALLQKISLHLSNFFTAAGLMFQICPSKWSACLEEKVFAIPQTFCPHYCPNLSFLAWMSFLVRIISTFFLGNTAQITDLRPGFLHLFIVTLLVGIDSS